MHEHIELHRTSTNPLTIPSSSLLAPSLVTIDFDEEDDDLGHHHNDSGGWSFVNGPRDFHGGVHIRFEGFPENTEIQWRLYKIKADGSGVRTWTGQADEFKTGGGPEGHIFTTHKLLKFNKRVGENERLRFELTAMHEDLTLPQGWIKEAWLEGDAFSFSA